MKSLILQDDLYVICYANFISNGGNAYRVICQLLN